MTRTHAFNLSRFVFGYKLLCALLGRIDGQKSQWHSFISAFFVGSLVFGEDNGVNTQINLYLLSRIIYGLVKLGAEKKFIPQPSRVLKLLPIHQLLLDFPVFPWFAAAVWGTVLWMFECNLFNFRPSRIQF